MPESGVYSQCGVGSCAELYSAPTCITYRSGPRVNLTVTHSTVLLVFVVLCLAKIAIC